MLSVQGRQGFAAFLSGVWPLPQILLLLPVAQMGIVWSQSRKGLESFRCLSCLTPEPIVEDWTVVL